MDKLDDALRGTIKKLWPIEGKKMHSLLIPHNEGILTIIWLILPMLKCRTNSNKKSNKQADKQANEVTNRQANRFENRAFQFLSEY